MNLTKLREISQKNKFVAIEFDNGHRHTIKAFGQYNQWIGSKKSGISNQIDYIKYIMKKEHTEIYDIATANLESKAIEKEIIDEEGGFI